MTGLVYIGDEGFGSASTPSRIKLPTSLQYLGSEAFGSTITTTIFLDKPDYVSPTAFGNQRKMNSMYFAYSYQNRIGYEPFGANCFDVSYGRATTLHYDYVE